MGVLVSLIDMGDGTCRVILDGVRSDLPQRETSWRSTTSIRTSDWLRSNSTIWHFPLTIPGTWGSSAGTTSSTKRKNKVMCQLRCRKADADDRQQWVYSVEKLAFGVKAIFKLYQMQPKI